MLFIKAFHVIFMVCWFAGLFYLPRLFVYHVSSSDTLSIDRFKLMEWRLFYYISTPSMVLTALSGFTLIHLDYAYYSHLMWLHIKLIFVFFLGIYHLYCGKCLHDFRKDANNHSEKFYRYFNEIPALLLVVIIVLAIVKP